MKKISKQPVSIVNTSRYTYGGKNLTYLHFDQYYTYIIIGSDEELKQLNNLEIQYQPIKKGKFWITPKIIFPRMAISNLKLPDFTRAINPKSADFIVIDCKKVTYTYGWLLIMPDNKFFFFDDRSFTINSEQELLDYISNCEQTMQFKNIKQNKPIINRCAIYIGQEDSIADIETYFQYPNKCVKFEDFIKLYYSVLPTVNSESIESMCSLFKSSDPNNVQLGLSMMLYSNVYDYFDQICINLMSGSGDLHQIYNLSDFKFFKYLFGLDFKTLNRLRTSYYSWYKLNYTSSLCKQLYYSDFIKDKTKIMNYWQQIWEHFGNSHYVKFKDFLKQRYDIIYDPNGTTINGSQEVEGTQV